MAAIRRMAPSPPPTPSPNAKRARTGPCPSSLVDDVTTTEIISPQVAAELTHHVLQPLPVALAPSLAAPLPAVPFSPCMHRSMALLEHETREARLRVGEKEMVGKGTAKSYPRQVHNYQTWFDKEQMCVVANDPTRVIIPAFPITAVKVAMFLLHELTCEKVSPPHQLIPSSG
jgi:hypothetical protein